MDPVDVTDVDTFRRALASLQGLTHGDTLSIYLALKKNEDRLPHVGDPIEGLQSRFLENLLDEFYLKTHRDLGNNRGKVCRIFSNSFTETSSYGQNNWRDFFRYALGVGCLAPEDQFTTAFLAEPRRECAYLVGNGTLGEFACRLHPIQTRYIRTLSKPKLLHWHLETGTRGWYKVVALDNPAVTEQIRPFARKVPLEPLVIALYFGATWNRRPQVSTQDFVTDFRFQDIAEVESLFATDVDDPALRPAIRRSKQQLIDKLQHPFQLTEPFDTRMTTTERRVRLQAFRETVLEAYGNACAVCQLSVQSIRGRWEVQAVHIYDHARGGSDDIRNGIALCRTHHWAFDEKLFMVDTNYSIEWHPNVRRTPIANADRLTLPQGTRTWPDQTQALEWHREETRDRWAEAPVRPSSSPPPMYP